MYITSILHVSVILSARASESSTTLSPMSGVGDRDLSGYSATTVSQTSSDSQDVISPSLVRDGASGIQASFSLRSGQMMSTPAPGMQNQSLNANERKERSPPTPPVNSSTGKQPRTESPEVDVRTSASIK